jgi:hypothetical protein
MLNLPRIENCRQLRNLIVQQGNNYIWWYTKKYEKIRFKTTESQLNDVYNRNVVWKSKWSMKCEDIVMIDGDNNTAKNEDDDDDIQWIMDP